MPHLEHLGIAVTNPDAVIQLYETLLGTYPYKAERVEREGVQTHFLSAGSAKLELLEALGPDSPVARYLDKRGEGLHHLAFEVDDIDAHMQALREAGFTPLSDTPRTGADGKRIFFLHPKQTHGVLVEFCQSTPQAFPPTRIPYRDGHLAVYERGATRRPTIVLLPAVAGSTLLDTQGLINHLETRFHILALDFAGHGGSDAFDDAPFSLDGFADNVRAVFEHFGLERAHLFGTATGGLVALHTAARHPERVDRLALFGTVTNWTRARVTTTQAALDADSLATQDPSFVQRLEAHHSDWRRLFVRAREMVGALPAQQPELQTLLHIRHPVLVTAVDQDSTLPVHETLALHQAFARSTLAVLPGSRHALDALDVALYARLLEQYVEG
jgi:methylmalonyl-CoA epimerase